jgi:phosphoribosylglycinamide formyltransferase-1
MNAPVNTPINAERNSTVRIAILASGGGSGFEAIAAAVRLGKLQAEIVAVVSDQPQAGVIAKAKALGIATLVVPWEHGPGLDQSARAQARAAHDTMILQALDALTGGRPRFLVFAGYMRIVTPILIRAFRDEKPYSRLVNIHPSLLPAFPGVGGYAQAFLHGVKLAGMTVHLIDEELDSGPICAQRSFSIEGLESVAEVERLGKELECQLYPEALQWILPEKFSVEHRAVDPALQNTRLQISQASQTHQASQRRLSVRTI